MVTNGVRALVEKAVPLAAPVFDAFATPLTFAHYVELVNPLWSDRKLQARVVDVRDETRDARTLVLQPGRNWRRHKAGQHIRIGLSVDGRQYTRTYTLSSSPERKDGLISITVKIQEGGRMSRRLVREVDVGQYIPIGLPQGEFTVPEAVPIRPLFITAGSGITPVASILRTYSLTGNMPDATHIHYAPHEYDFIFGPELAAMADRHSTTYELQPVHTRDLASGEPADGRHFSADQLEELVPDWREREVWACGPQSLLDDVEAHLAADGSGVRLHTERFRAALVDLDDDAAGGEVTFRAPDGSTTTSEADGQTPLLRVAEDAGLNPAHGCRMGICHTCDSPLHSGSVRDMRTGELLTEPGHTVQVCVAAAAGACEIELRPA